MEPATPDPLESYRQDISYEALRESMTNEIARHLAAFHANEHGAEAALHDAAVAKLIAARRLLNPDDTAAIEIASLIMDSYRDKVPAEAR